MPKKLLILFIAIFCMLVAGTRVGTALHEFFGHCAAAVLSGGAAYGFHIEYFGGGWAYTGGPDTSFIHISGIVVNLIVGSACLLAAFLIARRRPLLALSLTVFGGINLIGGLQYAVLSSYYEFGDAHLAEGQAEMTDWIWVVGIGAMLPAAFIWMVKFIGLAQAYFMVDRGWKLAGLVACSFGAAVVCYGALLYMSTDNFAQADAKPRKEIDVEAQLKREKAEELEGLHARMRGELARKGEPIPEELTRKVDEEKMSVSEDEVDERMPFPIEIPMLLIYIASFMATAVFGVFVMPVQAQDGPIIGWKAVILWVAAASACLLVLMAFGKEFLW